MRKQARLALSICGDLDRIASDYDIAKLELIGDAVVYLLRKDAAVELMPPDPPSAGRPFIVQRKPVEREGFVERQLREDPKRAVIAIPARRTA